jgi:hypothetical protein
MKNTKIKRLLEYVKPHQKRTFLRLIVQMDDALFSEAKDFLEKDVPIQSWKDNPQEFMRIILEACCDEYGTTATEVMSGVRLTNQIEAKRAWIYLCDGAMPKNYPLIAEFIGMDASSIVYHIRKTNGFMFSSKDYRQRIGKIAQAIKIEGLDEVTDFYTNKINEVVKYLNDKMAKKRF